MSSFTYYPTTAGADPSATTQPAQDTHYVFTPSVYNLHFGVDRIRALKDAFLKDTGITVAFATINGAQTTTALQEAGQTMSFLADALTGTKGGYTCDAEMFGASFHGDPSLHGGSRRPETERKASQGLILQKSIELLTVDERIRAIKQLHARTNAFQ